MQRWARVLFVPVLILVLVLAIMPRPPRLAGMINDKVEHGAAFAVLSTLGLVGFSKHGGALLLSLVGLGAIIEIAQGTSLSGRDPELLDWIADVVGIGVISVMWLVLGGNKREAK